MEQLNADSTTGTLKKVAENVWIFDEASIDAAGLRLPIRMTIIRLESGDLLLHSPTRYSSALREQLEHLGTIRFFLAPSIAHWMFIPEWQRALPSATVFTAPGLGGRKQVRDSGLRIDQELFDRTPEEWGNEIETILISGPLFAEIALFHRTSRTLVLTDIVQNLRPEGLPRGMRMLAELLGITAPDGRAPLYVRCLLRLGGRAAEMAAARLISLAPEQVIFAHGDWFSTDAAARLRRSLRWLTGAGDAPMDGARPGGMTGIRVVITGASSGIGRATALAFARRGASVVLAARRDAILRRVAAECEALGGRALVVPTDVTDPDAVKRLAERADEAFGGIDVWINNAGTGVFGPYQDADIALHRRTVEVNLLGTMHGAFAALPIFLHQARGVLINNISIGGWTPTPFAAAYTASKFGLRGFTASLRQELAGYPGIHVCGVFPAIVDTPGFVHGANMSGRGLDPGPFLYQPEDVAETFLRLVQRPRDEVAVGWPARAGQISYAAAPALTERVMGAGFRFLLSRAHRADKTKGTMLEPAREGAAASGGWLARKALPPAGQISGLAALAGLAVITLGAVAVLRGQRGLQRDARRQRSERQRLSLPHGEARQPWRSKQPPGKARA
jgi:short-subunit dehydrogenase